MAPTKQIAVRMDEETIVKLAEIGRRLSPPGRPLTVADQVRVAVELASLMLPHVQPLADRLRNELGFIEPFGPAMDRIAASGVQGAHRQTDADVKAAKK